MAPGDILYVPFSYARILSSRAPEELPTPPVLLPSMPGIEIGLTFSAFNTLP